jgi:crossover junction endodeoxyribonuclease RuvC
MRILGIDPGLAIVGWGVIDYEKSKFRTVAYGSLQTPAGIPTERRLALIYDGMKQLIEKYSPEVMSIEELFFSTNVTTGIRVAEARGVLLLAAEQAGIPMHEYTPPQVKQAVVGYGKAEKKQVIAMVTTLLGLKEPPKPDDTADALAVAICHAHSGGSRLASYYNHQL